MLRTAAAAILGQESAWTGAVPALTPQAELNMVGCPAASGQAAASQALCLPRS